MMLTRQAALERYHITICSSYGVQHSSGYAGTAPTPLLQAHWWHFQFS